MADRKLTTNTKSQAESVANVAVGQWVADAGSNAVNFTFDLGFVPRYVKFVNATDRIIDEFFEGMTADNAVEQAANGTTTLETSGGITINDGTAGTARGFTVDATLVPASKTGYYVALG